MRATGMPDWMVMIVALQAASTDGNGQTPADDRLGNAIQLQRHLGDDAERALGADEQPREVVAGGGFLGAARGRDRSRRSASTALSASTLSRIVP